MVNIIKLYFGNIPTIISTGLIVLFAFFFKDVVSRNPEITRWGPLALRMCLLGFIMSAMSGAKDYSGVTPAIEFGPGNIAFIILSVLGGVAALLGLMTLISKNPALHKVVFYTLSTIVIIKIAIVEIMRIVKRPLV